MSTIAEYRAFYANFIVRSAGSASEALIAAFAAVEREKFVGEGPWPVYVGSGYIQTLSADPRLLYQDILIGLAVDRKINNGQPSLHARCLTACAPKPGEAVVHVGAGTGYYTAILSALVGTSGSIIAYEIEADLATRATANLADLANVTVLRASATEASIQNADLIYVNAGATHPVGSWLDALNIGGRLIFPLTPKEGFGCMLLVTRRGPNIWAATIVGRVAFIPCVGARDDAQSDALTVALETQPIRSVKSLRIGTAPDATAWCVGSGWWLSTAEPS